MAYGLLAGLAIALLIAALTDIRSRLISNRLNGVIALNAPLFWWASGLDPWPGLALQLAVALTTFAVCAGLFALRAMGGGDVKLLTALALWIEPGLFVHLVIATALLGGLLTLCMLVLGAIRRRSERLEIPYGVAIALAGLWVLASAYGPGAHHTVLG